LRLLGKLLEYLMPVFDAFAEMVDDSFGFVLETINDVIKGIEKAVNWVIDKINGLIRGINDMGGWLGIHIEEIQKVTLEANMGSIADYKGGKTPDTAAPPTADAFDMDELMKKYGIVIPGYGDTLIDDHSVKNQDVTVVIQNYAQEVDVDRMVAEINRKLAEAM
jgi:hypothetical protein